MMYNMARNVPQKPANMMQVQHEHQGGTMMPRAITNSSRNDMQQMQSAPLNNGMFNAEWQRRPQYQSSRSFQVPPMELGRQGASVFHENTPNFNNNVMPYKQPNATFGSPAQYNFTPGSSISLSGPKDNNEHGINRDNLGKKVKLNEREVPASTASAQVAMKAPGEEIRIFTGSCVKLIKWYRIYQNHFCYYEVIAPVIAIKEGNVRLQKIMLLRDQKGGPILQVVYYETDRIKIDNFDIGQMLRCVGRMVGPNMLHGMSIREASSNELEVLERMCHISDRAVAKSALKQ